MRAEALAKSARETFRKGLAYGYYDLDDGRTSETMLESLIAAIVVARNEAAKGEGKA